MNQTRKVPHQRVGKRRASTERVGGEKVAKTKDIPVYSVPRGTKRKADTEREGGEKKSKTKGKTVPPKLKINVGGLPPSLQSSTREFGQKAEKGSVPGTKSQKTLDSATSKRAASKKANVAMKRK